MAIGQSRKGLLRTVMVQDCTNHGTKVARAVVEVPLEDEVTTRGS